MKKWMSLLLALLLVLGMSSMAAAGTVNPLGEVANGEYVNDFFGLRVKLPDNWNFFSDEEVAKLMGYDARYADRDARASLLDSRPAVCGMLASDGGNSKAVFMVEDLRTNSRLAEQE